MRSTTDRDYLGWQYHLQQELNTPSRLDHYVMQLTSIVAGLFSKKKPKSDDFKIKFTFGPHQKIELTPDQIGERNKQFIMAAVEGGKSGNRPAPSKNRS